MAQEVVPVEVSKSSQRILLVMPHLIYLVATVPSLEVVAVREDVLSRT